MIEVLSGAVASRGKYLGKVKVVTSLEDVMKVKEGDVVVTNDNSPLFTMAFLKAHAIIGESGGTLCHLAIVAREMEKPCILGVEGATEKLKDSMIVEVDANENKITILKNG